MRRVALAMLLFATGLTWSATPADAARIDAGAWVERALLAVGGAHSCALPGAGTIRCWGANDSGQIGNGTTTVAPQAVEVTAVAGAVSVAAGAEHSCAVLAGGTLQCWGANDTGQLGNNTTSSTPTTTPVTVFQLGGAVGVAVGDAHSCALLADGTVKCWGANNVGQLGNQTTNPSSVPVLVFGITDAVAIATGANHSCAVLATGTVKCWGANDIGQLGNNTTTTQPTTAPVSVYQLTGACVIAAGAFHSCAVLAGGTASCWGQNLKGQLGNNSNTSFPRPVPVRVSATVALSNVASIAAGGQHSCAALAGGGVSCWGFNGSGQLGNGTLADSNHAVSAVGLSNIIAVGAGDAHSCALTAARTAECWGKNDSGQLGNARTVSSSTPIAVSGLTAVDRISASNAYGCAVLQSPGTVKCWGKNDYGQIGDGTKMTQPAPKPVVGISDAIAVSTGWYHACALLKNNTVKCWGRNTYGQLGNGNLVDSTAPVAVVTASGVLTNVTAITAGEFYTCALLGTNTVMCWGGNGYGQLGDGTTNMRSKAAPVPTLSSVVGIDGGSQHVCAALQDERLKCWGRNNFGQIGNGQTSPPSAPVLAPVYVTGFDGSTVGTRATMVAGGAEHSCARVEDGTMKCWGHNNYGQLGIGTTATQKTVPTTVVDTGGSGVLSNVSAVTASLGSSCAMLQIGSEKCWGKNTYGELGDGTTTNRTSPVAVGTLGGVVAIATASGTGAGHSCSMLGDTTEKCWGDNALGQLGDDNAPVDSLVPVEVHDLTGLLAAVSVTAGGTASPGVSHSCALLGTGTAQCWGANASGQLGNGSTSTQSLVPVTVRALANAVGIAAGGTHTCAAIGNGGVKCWGANAKGQLGLATTAAYSATPVQIQASSGVALTGAVAVASGENFSCALLASGTVKCWGANGSRQLGLAVASTTTTSPTPVQIQASSGVPLTGVVAITTGRAHACALLAAGTVKCWGLNDTRQLGPGVAATTSNSPTPTTITGLTGGVTAISAGAGHTCALLGNGTAQCWGANASGQLGNNSTAPSVATPAQVLASPAVPLSGVTSLAVGANHSCARLAAASAKCWGANASGQLGNGSTAPSSTAVAVTGSAGSVVLGAGLTHSCAVSKVGTVQCWGANGQGQLGNDTTSDSSVPVQVLL